MSPHRPPRFRLTAPLLAALTTTLLLPLILSGCGGTGDTTDTGDTGATRGPEVSYDFQGTPALPIPPEIHPNVDFWRHVYGIWGRGDVAIHDQVYMEIIHEVVRLPEPIREGYTESQKELIRARTELHRQRMRDLEQRVASGQTLSAADRALLARFERAGGRQALPGASERIRSQRGLRERFRRGLEISGRYDPAFRQIMRQQGVPEDLAYLPHVESSFQTNARSKVGAGGVWQFMPDTGRMLMTVNDTVDERYDPILAAEGAARYLSKGYNRLRSWPLAITAYNHGQGGMAAAKAQYGDNIGKIVRNYRGPGFGFASRNFYSEFLAAREVARNAGRYFPEGVRYESPWPHDRLVLRQGLPVPHIAQHYGLSTGSLAPLNLHLSERALAGTATLPAGSTLWLPAGSLRRVASHPAPLASRIVKVEPIVRPPPAVRIEPVERAAAPAKPKPTVIAAAPPKSKPGPSPTPAAAKPAAVKSPAAAKSAPAKTPVAAPVPKKPATPAKPASGPRYHVVKPDETLYRVAVQNGLTVEELRRLNRMAPNDNSIRPGQKLKTGS